MKTFLRELWGLFVDDGALALGLLVWCAASAVLLPAVLPHLADGVVFFIGCLVVLIGNVTWAALRASRPHVESSATPHARFDFAHGNFRGGESSLR